MRGDAGETGAQDPLELRVRERRVVAEPSEEHKAVPLLLDDRLARSGAGLTIEELPAGAVAIRTHVKAAQFPGGRHIHHVVAQIIRVAETEGINVIVAHR